MIYAVTGSNGFIGKHLCQRLGDVVKVERNGNLPECDVVYHLASYGNHYFQKDVIQTVNTNIIYLAELIRQAKKMGAKFYNVSSSSVTLKIQTTYSATKIIGENLTTEAGFINIRPYSVYGEGEAEHRLIPTIIRCLRTGEAMELAPDPVHDWIHVQDFISAMLDGHTEIGTGIQYTNLEIVRMLEQISGKKLNVKLTEKVRNFDTDNWKCENGVPHQNIINTLQRLWNA